MTTAKYRISLPLVIALVLITGVWAGGAVWSFAEQTAYARFTHFEIPELLPLVIDGLAVAMAAVAWAASLDGRAAIGARIGAALAVAGSAASNAAWAAVRSDFDAGTIALAIAVPVAANIAFEVLLAEIRKQVQRYRGLPAPPQLPSPHWKRMCLSPFRTFFQWRREVLKATELAPLFAAAKAAAEAQLRGFAARSGTPAGTPVKGSVDTPAPHPWKVPVEEFSTVPLRCAAPLRNRRTTPRNPAGGTGTGTPAPQGVNTPANGSATPLYDTLTKGAGTPARNPSDTPAEPRRNPGAVKGAVTPVTSGGTPVGTPRQNPSAEGSGTPDEYPADGVLLPVLRNPAKVSRDPDGTVPVKRAMRVLGVGRPRAIRLLNLEGLLPGTGSGTPDAKGADTPGGTPAPEGSDDDQERHPEPLNGSREHPEFAGVA
jgi:hypothetical protein